ncbi:hypothetical protein H4R18_003790 [Coemansia javaensis]|uniref:Uncharacterized protein n=1 Tax=Coemansia javaensis TaxID=2761396 RepID=A0A9W8LH57_9FUNG|nr:hypothetical protein H4R18_003790 [Coemansia javaensis]
MRSPTDGLESRGQSAGLGSSPPPSTSSSSTSSSSSSSAGSQRTESFQAVWRLHCKHCHVLWSSRGMEAVVMARPAIRCYSTDLPPLGCDVVHQQVAPALAELIMGAGCTTCSSLTHHARRFDLAPSGPCDCHVQDIACLGCGNLVGYYIHRPCFRCLAQRLRIKQRGFQHLWTFYQDNVLAVQRENDTGDPVGWEELPAPPPPVATAIRDPPPQSREARTPFYSRRASAALPPPPPLQRPALDAPRTPQSPGDSAPRRAAPASISASMSASMSTSTPALVSASTSTATLGDPTPLRVSTQSTRAAAAAAVRHSDRRDEVMEPLCPPKPLAARPAPPPAGLCNWLFQVGLDCMVKWEEVSLSR